MSRVGRTALTQMNWPLVGVTLLIAGVGVYNLASAARATNSELWLAQLTWIGLGAVAVAVVAAVDYRILLRLSWPLWIAGVLLLLVVLIKGVTVMGAQRWLVFGPIRMQPSEIMKLGVVVALAAHYHEARANPQGFSELLKPLAIVGIPFVLIVRQPDLGTAMLVAAIGGSIAIFHGVRARTLAVLGLGGVALATAGWMWFLRDYQRRRVLTFLDPEGDALGAGYHAQQSVIAIGSGRLTGKGWGQGTQTQLSFLPEQHTDFVFSVWGEEWGFLGSLIVIGLYLGLLWIAVEIAEGARERFGSYLAVGVVALVFWHVFINIGMVTGLLPVVGVTLPLLSYGGSSLVTTLVGIGLLLNVSSRRHLF